MGCNWWAATMMGWPTMTKSSQVKSTAASGSSQPLGMAPMQGHAVQVWPGSQNCPFVVLWEAPPLMLYWLWSCKHLSVGFSCSKLVLVWSQQWWHFLKNLGRIVLPKLPHPHHTLLLQWMPAKHSGTWHNMTQPMTRHSQWSRAGATRKPHSFLVTVGPEPPMEGKVGCESKKFGNCFSVELLWVRWEQEQGSLKWIHKPYLNYPIHSFIL